VRLDLEIIIDETLDLYDDTKHEREDIDEYILLNEMKSHI
jgi:hypothetical protein